MKARKLTDKQVDRIKSAYNRALTTAINSKRHSTASAVIDAALKRLAQYKFATRLAREWDLHEIVIDSDEHRYVQSLLNESK